MTRQILTGVALALGFCMTLEWLNNIYLLGFIDGQSSANMRKVKRKGNVFMFPFKGETKETEVVDVSKPE